MTTTPLQLLSRPGCHLCEVAARDLARMGLAFDLVDIDGDDAMAGRYGEAIPVLLAGETEIVRAPFTVPALRQALASHGLVRSR